MDFHAGAIQAGISLDFGSKDGISSISISVGKLSLYPSLPWTIVEGTNGQMPNLDLINLTFQIARIEGTPVKLDITPSANRAVKDHPFADYTNSLRAMLSMMKNQALCSPSGVHGVLLK